MLLCINYIHLHPDIFSSMKSKNEFVIPFEGLKIGKYLYEYQVDTSFFEELDYSIIQGGDIKVNFNLEKKEPFNCLVIVVMT